MILALTAQKGGVGKSTLAYNLATLFARDGINVGIADSDDNQHCLYWQANRQENNLDVPLVEVTSTPDEYLKSELRNLQRRHDLIIVDGKPTLGKVNTKILYLADYVLIPLKGSAMDGTTLETFYSRIQDVGRDREETIPTGAFFNDYESRNQVDKLMKSQLKNHPLNLFTETIGHRAIYRKSFIMGLGIAEMYDDKGRLENENAVSELETFYKALRGRLSKIKRGKEILMNSAN